MEHLLADNDGLATSSALLNATTEMERKLSATAAQQFIKLLLKDKWLEQVVSVITVSRAHAQGIKAIVVFFRSVLSITILMWVW